MGHSQKPAEREYAKGKSCRTKPGPSLHKITASQHQGWKKRRKMKTARTICPRRGNSFDSEIYSSSTYSPAYIGLSANVMSTVAALAEGRTTIPSPRISRGTLSHLKSLETPP